MTDLPSITLGGISFPVKELVIEQLETVVPALMRLRGVALQNITSDLMRDLTETIYQAIAPGQATPMKRSDFKALKASPYELFGALDVIIKQAGMARTTPGEAQAATEPPSIGTDS